MVGIGVPPTLSDGSNTVTIRGVQGHEIEWEHEPRLAVQDTPGKTGDKFQHLGRKSRVGHVRNAVAYSSTLALGVVIAHQLRTWADAGTELTCTTVTETVQCYIRRLRIIEPGKDATGVRFHAEVVEVPTADAQGTGSAILVNGVLANVETDVTVEGEDLTVAVGVDDGIDNEEEITVAVTVEPTLVVT